MRREAKAAKSNRPLAPEPTAGDDGSVLQESQRPEGGEGDKQINRMRMSWKGEAGIWRKGVSVGDSGENESTGTTEVWRVDLLRVLVSPCRLLWGPPGVYK